MIDLTDKKAVKRARLAVLQEWARLDDHRCELCSGHREDFRSKAHTDCCPASKAILEIGKKLERLVAPRRRSEIVTGGDIGMLSIDRPKKKSIAELIDRVLTTKEYYRLHKSGISDRQIATDLGFEPHQIRDWKKERGIKTVHPSKSSQMSRAGLTPEQYYKYKDTGLTDAELAELLDVSFGALVKWKSAQGVTLRDRKGVGN